MFGSSCLGARLNRVCAKFPSATNISTRHCLRVTVNGPSPSPINTTRIKQEQQSIETASKCHVQGDRDFKAVQLLSQVGALSSCSRSGVCRFPRAAVPHLVSVDSCGFFFFSLSLSLSLYLFLSLSLGAGKAKQA